MHLAENRLEQPAGEPAALLVDSYCCDHHVTMAGLRSEALVHDLLMCSDRDDLAVFFENDNTTVK